MSMADKQKELNPPREVNSGRKPKFTGEASNKIGLTLTSNEVKCSYIDTFKYDVVSDSDY